MAMRKTQAGSLRGSKKAKQIAVAVLEALSGELGTTEAAARLGVSLSRYYQLETRALEGLLRAVEPRPKGPQKTPEREIRALQAEKRTLEKELRRHQALLRAAHRSVGLPSKPASSKTRARKKRGCRGQTVLQTLRRDAEGAEGGAHGTDKQHAEAGGEGGGESAGA